MSLIVHPSASSTQGSISNKRPADRLSGTPPAPEKPSKRSKKKETSKERRARGRRSQTKLKTIEVPANAKGLKKCFELHICLLAGLHSQHAVMSPPTVANLARFEERFHDKDAVFAARMGPSLLEKTATAQIAELRVKKSASQISRDLARIEEHHLQMIVLQLSRYGLSAWRPNYDETAYSVYNNAMRVIALDTFKNAAASHAYAFLDTNLPISDTAFLTRLYDNYVHEYQYNKFVAERNQPGSVSKNIQLNVMYKRRVELGEKRAEFLRAEGYPTRVVRLVEDPECNSDDEEVIVDGRIVYKVKAKPFRSQDVTRFLHWIDEQRVLILHANGQRKRGAKERSRIVSDSPEDASVPTLPLAAVLDWFDAALFNTLPMLIRARYAHKPLVAFPKDVDVWASEESAQWKAMSDAAFMTKHGDAVLANYRLPSPGELMNMAQNVKLAPKRRAKAPRPNEGDDDEDFVSAFDAAGKKKKGAKKDKKGKGKAAVASSSQTHVEDLDPDSEDDEDEDEDDDDDKL